MAMDHAIDGAGFALSLAGQLLRVLVIGLVYITRGGQNRQIWANALVDRGIFAHCRNPLYLGNLLIISGLAIVHGGWAMSVIAVPFFALAYAAVVRAEEWYLRDRFGEAYARYCARVPRWRPLLRGLPATWRAGRFDWLKVIRKEYGTPFAWLSGFLALLLFEHSSPSAPPLDHAELQTVIAAWVALAVVYLIARTLKLRGLLGHG
jgi:Phospholipid methyltransferase